MRKRRRYAEDPVPTLVLVLTYTALILILGLLYHYFY